MNVLNHFFKFSGFYLALSFVLIFGMYLCLLIGQHVYLDTFAHLDQYLNCTPSVEGAFLAFCFTVFPFALRSYHMW